MVNNETAQSKHELNIYQFSGNLLITNLRDCVDIINYLVGFLARANIITNPKIFFEEFQDSIERIGTPAGKLQVIGYGVKELV